MAPWAGCVIGLVSGCVYCLGSGLLVKLKIDDAVDGIPVHLFGGIWGCIATGLFAEPVRTMIAFGDDVIHYGWFYSWGDNSGDANLLLAEICGILFIIAWTVGIMGPFFFVLDLVGLFRADVLEELAGMDVSCHKGSAYDDSGRPSDDAIGAYENSRHGKKKGLDLSRSDKGPNPNKANDAGIGEEGPLMNA